MADSLIVKIDGDTKGFKRSLDDLDDTAKKSFGGLRSVASKAGAIATAAIVGAGTAMGTAGVYAINLASDLEEVQNVVDTTFGKNANVVNDWAKKAGKAFGLSELEAKKFNGTMGAMLKSMGLTDDQILEMSTSMVGLSGDFASFYNLPAEEAFAKIRSGISGETEPLKQLGINMSVANLEAFALAEGINKSYSEMTQAEQATLRYNYLMSVTADAQGDFAKTSDSFANQMRILKLNISDLAASLGKILLPIATSVIKKITDITGALAEGFDTSGFDGLMDKLGEMIPALNPVINAFKFLKTNISGVASSLKKTLLPIINSLIQRITDIATSLWETMIPKIIVIIQNMIDKAKQIWDIVSPIITSIIQLIKDITEKLWDTFLPIATSVIQKVIDLSEKLWDKILPIATSIGEKITDITGALSEGFDTGGFDGLMDALGDSIPILNPVIDAIQYLRNNFDTLAPIIAGVTASMIAFKAAMAIQGIISGVTTAIHAFSAANIGATAAQAALNFVMSLNPFVLIATLIAGVTVALITLWKTNDDFRNAVTSAWESIKNAFTTALEAISAGFANLQMWFSALPAQISGWLAGIWTSVSGWLTSTAENISGWFTSTWQTITSFLAELPGKVWDWLSQTFDRITTFFSDTKAKAETETRNIIDNIVSFFSELPGKVWDWLSQTIDKISQFFTNFANKVKTETPRIINDFVGWFRDLPSRLFEIGGNIVSGLWNGISNSWQWLKDQVNGLVSGFVDGIKGGLGIGSPSKVFASIGSYITEGLEVGIESRNNSLAKAAKDQIDELSSVYEKSEVGLNIKNRLSSAKSALNSAFSGSISGAQLVAQTISSDTSDTFYVYVNGSNGEKLGTDLYREFQRRKRYKGGL